MDSNSVSPLPPPEAPLALMENEKTPPGTPSGNEMPPPPDEKRYEEERENLWTCASWFEYLLTVILSTILLVGVLVLTMFWVLFYRGGFSWTGRPDYQFNIHPVLMIGSMITLNGYTILLYRLCRCLKQVYVKCIHMFFHACIIPLFIFGVWAVFESNERWEKPRPHFDSLHSWMGLVTIGLFLLQFLFGFISFVLLAPCRRSIGYRSAMIPIHASLGLANFMLAVATCTTGFIEHEKRLMELDKLSISNERNEHYIFNSAAMMLIAVGLVVSVAVRRTNSPASAKVYVTERI